MQNGHPANAEPSAARHRLAMLVYDAKIVEAYADARANVPPALASRHLKFLRF
jgi:hypothetical protein